MGSAMILHIKKQRVEAQSNPLRPIIAGCLEIESNEISSVFIYSINQGGKSSASGPAWLCFIYPQYQQIVMAVLSMTVSWTLMALIYSSNNG